MSMYILTDPESKQVTSFFYDVANAPVSVTEKWTLVTAAVPDAPQVDAGQEAVLCYDGTNFFYNTITTYTIDDARAAKKAELDVACQQDIEKGFTSSALGVAHTYPADDAAKTNLQLAMKRLELNPDTTATFPFETLDAGFIPHTLTQLQQVFCDGVDAGLVKEQKKIGLYTDADNATTVDAVNAISWG